MPAAPYEPNEEFMSRAGGPRRVLGLDQREATAGSVGKPTSVHYRLARVEVDRRVERVAREEIRGS